MVVAVFLLVVSAFGYCLVAVVFGDWFAVVFVCGFVTFLSFGFVSRLFVAWFVVVRPDLLFARLRLLLFIACDRL